MGNIKKYMRITAPAKINLGIEVLGKQKNGYHRVEMVMQSVSLCDVLTISYNNSQIYQDSKIIIHCNLSYVPIDNRNIVYQVTEYMINEFNIKGMFHIYIKKNIPVAAGLAGGSTDCAAMIKAINKLCKLGLNMEQMMNIGSKFGVDVLYCIHGGSVLANGIGDKLYPIKGLNNKWIVISKPNIFLLTSEIYKNLNYKPKSNEELNKSTRINSMNDIIKALENDDMNELNKYMFNRLETISEKLEPKISRIKECFNVQPGCQASMMSGSGPSVFGIFDSKENAYKAAYIIYSTLQIDETHVCITIN